MNPAYTCPLTDSQLADLARTHGTPLFVYHAETIAERINALRGFDVIRYAQKANSNVHLLEWMRRKGVQVDSVSAGEVVRALEAGFPLEEIVFTADIFDQAILELLAQYDIHVNLGSADMIEQYAAVRSPADITLRINPGFGHGHHRKVSTGGPESKHGIWHEDLPAVLQRAKRAGLTVKGIHMHIGSGSDFTHLSRVREAMAQAVLTAGENLTSVSVGGGLPVPYHPDETPFDVSRFTADWQKTKAELEDRLGRKLILEVEPGRYLVAEAGVLLAEVRTVKKQGDIPYVLVDAGFNDLVRPAMYGAYHHITAIGKEGEQELPQVVAGPLCESADVFTQKAGGELSPVSLPKVNVGDILVIHGAGAYAASMASNYNSRQLAAEVLVENGHPRLIRQRQTWDDLLGPERGL